MDHFNDYFKDNLLDLLNCNLQNKVFTEKDVRNIWNDLNVYINSTKTNKNYVSHPTLESWYGPGDGVFPDVHPHHKHLLGLIKKFNVTQKIYNHILSIPIYPTLSKNDIKYIVSCLNKF